MRKIYVLAAAALMMAACGNSEKEYDATGTFEATETTVFAEQSGALLTFSINEGDNVEAHAEVGLIDTTQIWLKIQQLNATKEVYQSQKPDMARQIAATRQQLDKAKQEQQRYKELVADGAAPSKMLDDAISQVKVLQKQLDAQISSLNTSTRALDKQTAAADIQVSQLRDQLRKCHILTPAKGTVLEKYVERGEFVTVRRRSTRALSRGFPRARSSRPRPSSPTTSVPTWCMPSRWQSETTDTSRLECTAK